MRNLIEKLRAMGAERVLENEMMSRRTTFRVGGPAELVFLPESAQEVCAAIAAAKECGVEYRVLGNGSNLLVKDGGLKGLTIILGEHFAGIQVEGNRICAQAGAMLSKVAMTAYEAGLTGLEFAGGIPGTLGGGCAMNAGAYGGELKDVLLWADVLLDGEIRRLSLEEMQMGYRTTMPLRMGGVVLEACFELEQGDRAAIQERMKDLGARRRDKQPLNLPSAGSTFKRPEGYFAGALIEQCGLKGFRVGGAQVSEKHAGFVVNTGSATARDILDLMKHVQETVQRETGVWLEPEVRILGED